MILALIEHDRGRVNSASLEMLTFARRLAAELDVPLEAVLVGADSRPLADTAAAYGASKCYIVEHEHLDDYAPEAWARGVTQLMETLEPAAVIGAGTDRGNELLAHIAAVSDLPFAANCTEVVPDADGAYRVTRVRWGGSLLEEARLSGDPQLLTVAPHTMEPEEVSGAAGTEVVSFDPSLDESAFRVRIKERIAPAGDKISLADARLVVGGGRGVGSSEGFAVLDGLAEALGGAVGGSRVVTNLGWRPHSDQIGQTGTRIAPDLYIACGISGAIQHMVGCKGSKHILAINTDREAPIMAKADYAVIGDVHEILPALLAEVERAKAA